MLMVNGRLRLRPGGSEKIPKRLAPDPANAIKQCEFQPAAGNSRTIGNPGGNLVQVLGKRPIRFHGLLPARDHFGRIDRVIRRDGRLSPACVVPQAQPERLAGFAHAAGEDEWVAHWRRSGSQFRQDSIIGCCSAASLVSRPHLEYSHYHERAKIAIVGTGGIARDADESSHYPTAPPDRRRRTRLAASWHLLRQVPSSRPIHRPGHHAGKGEAGPGAGRHAAGDALQHLGSVHGSRRLGHVRKAFVRSLAQVDRLADAEKRTGKYVSSVFQMRFGSGRSISRS